MQDHTCVETTQRLVSYYIDLLKSLSERSGSHFVNFRSSFQKGLGVDLGTYDISLEHFIKEEFIRFKIERPEKKELEELLVDYDAAGGDEATEDPFSLEPDSDTLSLDFAKSHTASCLINIYTKQLQDPINRETIFGAPVVIGTYGSIKFMAPLFFHTVNIDFDASSSEIVIQKHSDFPVLNLTLLAKLLGGGEELAVIRKDVLPLLYKADGFNADLLEKIIKTLSELVEGFRGISWWEGAPLLYTFLHRDLPLEPRLFKNCVLINATRSKVFLMDDLEELKRITSLDPDTAAYALLNPNLPDTGANDIIEPDDTNAFPTPLYFPLLSNKAQRRVARKAERARICVIQGPPGTGKSQTIANLVCHLTSQGKSVLVTSYHNKALEVISEKLPQIDYLAMSLLKGERQSRERLAQQLGSLKAFVSNLDPAFLKYKIGENAQKINELEKNLASLKARFSELKVLERNCFSDFKRYSEIKPFVGMIHIEDNIPPGLEKDITSSLFEWAQLYQKLYNDLYLLESYFGKENSSSTIHEIASALQRIVELYRKVKTILDDTSILKDFLREAKNAIRNMDNAIKVTEEYIHWLEGPMGDAEYISALCRIDSFKESLEFPSIESIVNHSKLLQDSCYSLKSLADKTLEKAKSLLQITPPGFSMEFPDRNTITRAEDCYRCLSHARNPLMWLLPGAISARKWLYRQGFGTVNRKTCEEFLDQLKTWLDYWKAYNDVLHMLRCLKDRGIPLYEIEERLSSHILVGLAEAVSTYAHLLVLFSHKPASVHEDELCSILDKHLINIKTPDAVHKFLDALYQLKAWLLSLKEFDETITIYSHLREVPLLSPAIQLIEDLHHTDNSFCEEDVLHHISLAGDYATLRCLENTLLRYIPRTLEKIAEHIREYGEPPEWAKKEETIETALEAYRLKKFVDGNLLKNPDDINEITRKIGKLEEERRNHILTGLKLRRRYLLAEAYRDRLTRNAILKLQKLVRRKRKTLSFIELKNAIDFSTLLRVFPCWIMSIEDASRIFPLKAGLFDYVIIDEASQCDQASAFPLAYRAKKMVVVGDSKQMKSPSLLFLRNDLVEMLMEKHGLQNHPKGIWFHGRTSFLDLAEEAADAVDFLNEHFRCEPPIIQWSNKHFYENKLRIMTPLRKPSFTRACEVILVRGADDDPEEKINILEAEAVVNKVEELLRSFDNPETSEPLTIGVISPFRKQANYIQRLLYERFFDQMELLKKHKLVCSTADGFQGDERDIILYSFRYGPSSSPGVISAIQSGGDPEYSEGRINVAFTRARRKVICFISSPPNNFPNGYIKDFLLHCLNEQKNPYRRLGGEEDKFDSEFEKEVCFMLRDRGLTVYTQVPCGPFFIDLVAEDSSKRQIAIECDGMFHYEPDGSLRPEDYQRQDIIERSGWVVYRVSARKFYHNPQAEIDKIINTLREQKPKTEILNIIPQEPEWSVQTELEDIIFKT